MLHNDIGSIGFEFARRMRDKVRGVYRFSSLVKKYKKAKICFVIHIAGERKLLFYIYDVIVNHHISKRKNTIVRGRTQ